MTELQRAMRVLIDRPPTAPAPIEKIAARSARFARRRRLLRGSMSLAVVAIASAAGLAVALHGSAPDQVVLSTEGPVSAGYIAEKPGGYVATGTWQLTITRGSEVIELRSPSSQSCGQTGTIEPGDEVRGWITGPDSSLRAGEDFACPGMSGAEEP